MSNFDTFWSPLDWYEQSQSLKLNDEMHFFHLIELSVKKVHIILTLYLKSYLLEVLKFIRKLFLPPSPHSQFSSSMHQSEMTLPIVLTVLDNKTGQFQLSHIVQISSFLCLRLYNSHPSHGHMSQLQ